MRGLVERVQAFRDIRDIPYRYDFDDPSQDTTCYSKAKRLRIKLAEFGIESRHMCCRHRWSASGMPSALVRRAPTMEAQHHYLEVMVPETRRWTVVDPTWDKGLKQAGFRIAEWDGIGPTTLAIDPVSTFSPEETVNICRLKDSVTSEMREDFKMFFGDFYRDLNAWIAAQRTPTTGMPGSTPAGRHYA